MTIRPRRSVLYMPGSNGRAIEKARTLGADGIILDLEDSVAPDAKAAARDQVVDAVKAGGFGHREVFVRINGMETEWGADDLAAATAAAPDAILVPKVSTSHQVELLGQRLLDTHTNLRTRLWVMIETPLAIFNITAIAACAADSETRLSGFVMGTNDLAKELQAEHVPGRQPLLAGLGLCLLAARATVKVILDGVYNDVADAQGFEAECRQGRQLGFDGKTLIHPNQLDPCNRVFAPAADEVERAGRIIEAFEQADMPVEIGGQEEVLAEPERGGQRQARGDARAPREPIRLGDGLNRQKEPLGRPEAGLGRAGGAGSEDDEAGRGEEGGRRAGGLARLGERDGREPGFLERGRESRGGRREEDRHDSGEWRVATPGAGLGVEQHDGRRERRQREEEREGLGMAPRHHRHRVRRRREPLDDPRMPARRHHRERLAAPVAPLEGDARRQKGHASRLTWPTPDLGDPTGSRCEGK